jgi:hypothetical protein
LVQLIEQELGKRFASKIQLKWNAWSSIGILIHTDILGWNIGVAFDWSRGIDRPLLDEVIVIRLWPIIDNSTCNTLQQVIIEQLSLFDPNPKSSPHTFMTLFC